MTDYHKFFINSELRDDKNQIRQAFPEMLKNDLEVVLNILPLNVNHSIFSTFSLVLDKNILIIPYRVYFEEPEYEKECILTDIQKTILHCIYVRHHNGYIRQKHLEQLIENTEYWVIPFTFQLLGEYILEIFYVLDKHINDRNISNYVKFVKENPRYFRLTESRVISYWDVYYRGQIFKYIKDYPGQKLIERIKKSMTSPV